MKLCIIGNSHTGSLKRAWDGVLKKQFESKVEITFYAHKGVGLSGLKLDGKRLIADNELLKKSLEFTSGGKEFVELAEYDIFLIYGVRLKAYFASKQFYSNNVLFSSIQDQYVGTLGYKLLEMLRESVDSEIYLGHEPLRAVHKRDKIDNTSDDYSRGIELANNQLFSKSDAVLVHQPQETLVGNNRNTNSKYSKGSKRLDVSENCDSKLHDEIDNAHMNDEYGRVWLNSFLTSLVI